MALCDVCLKREATIKHTKIINNRTEIRHLCEVCARQEGLAHDVGYFDFKTGWPDIDRLFNSFFGTGEVPERTRKRDILSYLSESGKKALEAAREIAIELNHDFLGAEHLLMGVLSNHNLATELLEEAGINTNSIKEKVRQELIPESPREITEITLTPRAKRALEMAFEISRSIGDTYIGPEHILLGIIGEGESPAARILKESGVSIEKIENELSRISGSGKVSIKSYSKTPVVDQFSRDLTDLARQGKLDPVIGRENEIDRMIRILSRRTKNNPVLIGEPGVGKTAIVEGLAQRIISGEVPEVLRNKRVIQLDLGGVVAGTKYRGEFEERMKRIIDEIRENSDELIIFIDELHTVVGAGAAEGAIDAGNMLKPSLAKGELHVIGATTLDEYRKYVERDAALERRFQPIFVSEPTLEQTINILKGLRDRYEAHHRVKITDEAITASANLSDKYISDRYLPDKAIDLMDEAASKVRLRSTAQPPDLKAMEEEIEKLESEKEAATRAEDYEKAAYLRDEVKKKREDYEKAVKEWQEKQGRGYGVVTAEDIAEVVSEWTGIPVKKLVEEEIQKYLKMEEALHRRIVGQHEAVIAVSEAVRRAMAGLKDPNRPIGSFLFLGPTGVGKTELARALAEFLFGHEDAMVRLDMSEYMEKHTVSRLVGSPPGYVGYEEGGQLTEAIRRRPYSVILLDEIEKAHPDVFNVLLQILDDGRLTDAKGRTVDFKNTLIIMTSNIGSHIIQDYAKKESKDTTAYEKMKEQVLSLVKNAFRPELLNRIDEIVVFHALLKEDIEKIIELMLEDVRRKLHGQAIELELTHKAKEALIEEGYDPQYGARPLKRTIRKRIENKLSEMLLQGKFKEGDQVIIDFEEDKNIFVATTKGKTRERKKQKEKKISG